MAGHIHNARRFEQDEGCVAGNGDDEAHDQVWLDQTNGLRAVGAASCQNAEQRFEVIRDACIARQLPDIDCGTSRRRRDY